MIAFVTALAWADATEDELFGGPPPEAAAVPEEEPTLTDAGIRSIFAEHEDDLVVGGRAYLRLDGPLALSSPNLLDLFVDARPNDRLRAYASARMKHDWTIQDGDTDPYGNAKEPTSVGLDQLWLKGDTGRRLYWTVGKQRIKWGSGRFWNPTDFLNQQARDPLAIYDERTGVGLVKLHVPVGAANLYAIANLEGSDESRYVGGAARAEVVLGPAEVAFSAAARENQPLRLGADVSAGLGPLDVHVEGAVRHGDAGPFWQGTLEFETFSFPEERDRVDDWIPQVVGGAELGLRYGDEDSVYVGAEYFWNDAGYDGADLYPWLFVKGGYLPFYVGRSYASAYVYLPSPGQLDDAGFTASWIGNLSDQSNLARLDVRWTVLTQLSVNVYGALHFGEPGELRYELEVEPIPGVLDDGLSIEPPFLDVGLGANLEF